jgi:hypothetical protein
MIEVFLFRLPADISRRPHTWSTRVRVEQAVPIHQVITSKTGHPVRPMGLTLGVMRTKKPLQRVPRST